MNKILLFALAIALFAGCSKKDNSTPSTGSLIGKWYLVTDTTNLYANNVLTDHEFDNYNHTDYVQFNEDGTGYDGSDDVDQTFNYKVSANNVVSLSYPTYVNAEKDTVFAFTKSSNYKISGNNLVVHTSDSETDNNIVYKLTVVSYLTK